ncbi:hypothetical protein [Paenibacillus glacialis]|uniref:Uncharacterized protein n=1 Tax=Paenibacillus glacialis TaxID=494026 RepID=A0A162PW87_9BACL|nr:hypothetical protein [Paenibacillus glacialis]OAB39810.1 hypothetical protein PGLA_18735 [Paenibacillus glacialis]
MYIKSARTWLARDVRWTDDMDDHDLNRYLNTTAAQVDEVGVFEMFGGDLPVMHQSRESYTENKRATALTTL